MYCFTNVLFLLLYIFHVLVTLWVVSFNSELMPHMGLLNQVTVEHVFLYFRISRRIINLYWWNLTGRRSRFICYYMFYTVATSGCSMGQYKCYQQFERESFASHLFQQIGQYIQIIQHNNQKIHQNFSEICLG